MLNSFDAGGEYQREITVGLAGLMMFGYTCRFLKILILRQLSMQHATPISKTCRGKTQARTVE